MKVGDRVRLTDWSRTSALFGGEAVPMAKEQDRDVIYIVSEVGTRAADDKKIRGPYVKLDGVQTPGIGGYYWSVQSVTLVHNSILSKGKAMFKTIANEVVSSIKEHKSLIMLCAALFAIDHFVFKGAFRERFKNLVEALIKKVEDKIKL